MCETQIGLAPYNQWGCTISAATKPKRKQDRWTVRTVLPAHGGSTTSAKDPKEEKNILQRQHRNSGLRWPLCQGFRETEKLLLQFFFFFFIANPKDRFSENLHCIGVVQQG